MREVNHLADLGHFREQAKCLLRAEIIERLHDIVGDERHRTASAGKLVIAGDA